MYLEFCLQLVQLLIGHPVRVYIRGDRKQSYMNAPFVFGTLARDDTRKEILLIIFNYRVINIYV